MPAFRYSLVDGSLHQTPGTGEARVPKLAGEFASWDGVLDLYQKAVPGGFFQRLKQELNLPSRRRIFDLPLVVWLMMAQRWDPKAALPTAVRQVVRKRL
ncbi:MAG: hypothetical protein HY822_13620, partial [Acidobacteria bacterium]|nr:hypothetical protein [Acidobacteriota bacterium]